MIGDEVWEFFAMRDSLVEILVAGAAAAATLMSSPVAPPPIEEPAICQEDEECWDCNTMGNLICGPIENDRVVVEYKFPRVFEDGSFILADGRVGCLPDELCALNPTTPVWDPYDEMMQEN